jgi:hypothetical protein
MLELFDVLEVSISTRKITMMGKDMTARNADVVERMAVYRRMTEDNYFITVPAGKYKDGDVFEREENHD